MGMTSGWIVGNCKFAGALDERAKMHMEITRRYRSEEELEVIARVRAAIIDGSNLLKEPLASGETDMEAVIEAIKSERCVPTTERDLGSTYLSSLVSNIIHDLYQGQHLNRIRRIFGLESLV